MMAGKQLMNEELRHEQMSRWVMHTGE